MDEGAFAVLEAELRARLLDIGRVADRIEARRARFDERAAEVDSLGYQLHNLYGAFEQPATGPAASPGLRGSRCPCNSLRSNA